MHGLQACFSRRASCTAPGVPDNSFPAVQKQDDKDAGRASADEGEVREEKVPPNVRVMETMLRHLDDHYDGIMGYLRHIGLTVAEARPYFVLACVLPTVLSITLAVAKLAVQSISMRAWTGYWCDLHEGEDRAMHVVFTVLCGLVC